jgi:hypothetical protein
VWQLRRAHPELRVTRDTLRRNSLKYSVGIFIRFRVI